MDRPEPNLGNIAAWPWLTPPAERRTEDLVFEGAGALLRALMLARGLALPSAKEQGLGWEPAEEACWLAQALLGCPPAATELRWQLGRVLRLRLEGRTVWLQAELAPLKQAVAATTRA